MLFIMNKVLIKLLSIGIATIMLFSQFVCLAETQEQINPFQKFLLESLSLKTTPRLELQSYLKKNLSENIVVNENHVKDLKVYLKNMSDKEIYDALKVYAARSATSKMGLIILITEGLHEINGDLSSCKNIVADFNKMVMTDVNDNRGISFILTILSMAKLITGQSVAFNGDDTNKIKFKTPDFDFEKRMISNAIDMMKTISKTVKSSEGEMTFDKLMNYSQNMVNGFDDNEIKAFKVILRYNGEVFGDEVGLFSDVSDVSWANEAIDNLAIAGVLDGVNDNAFMPNESVTREQFVKMIIKAFKIKEDNLQIEFNDVKKDEWYYSVVCTATKRGIVNGYPDGSFGIGRSITRQDATTILFRIAKMTGFDLSEKAKKGIFIDDNQISEYSKEAVYALQAAGVINGIEENVFSPNSTTTRAQAAKLIYGMTRVNTNLR